MFTVKKVEMITKTFRLPIDLVERLSIIAQEQGVSMNNLVTQCCEYALNEMKDSNSNANAISLKKNKEMTINITQN